MLKLFIYVSFDRYLYHLWYDFALLYSSDYLNVLYTDDLKSPSCIADAWTPDYSMHGYCLHIISFLCHVQEFMATAFTRPTQIYNSVIILSDSKFFLFKTHFNFLSCLLGSTILKLVSKIMLLCPREALLRAVYS